MVNFLGIILLIWNAYLLFKINIETKNKHYQENRFKQNSIAELSSILTLILSTTIWLEIFPIGLGTFNLAIASLFIGLSYTNVYYMLIGSNIVKIMKIEFFQKKFKLNLSVSIISLIILIEVLIASKILSLFL